MLLTNSVKRLGKYVKYYALFSTTKITFFYCAPITRRFILQVLPLLQNRWYAEEHHHLLRPGQARRGDHSYSGQQGHMECHQRGHEQHNLSACQHEIQGNNLVKKFLFQFYTYFFCFDSILRYVKADPGRGFFLL